MNARSIAHGSMRDMRLTRYAAIGMELDAELCEHIHSTKALYSRIEEESSILGRLTPRGTYAELPQKIRS